MKVRKQVQYLYIHPVRSWRYLRVLHRRHLRGTNRWLPFTSKPTTIGCVFYLRTFFPAPYHFALKIVPLLIQFFTTYQSLILSANYVTRRQSLKLLGEILLDRANFNIMTRYIGSKENLQIIMNTLRDKSKNIQYEAFHVFKVRQEQNRTKDSGGGVAELKFEVRSFSSAFY